MRTPFNCIGDAQTESALLTTAAGHDVARLERITPDGWPDLEPGNYLTDEEWQRTIDLVDAAPDLLDACRVALEVLKASFPLDHGNPQVGDAWGRLENAIAKAEPVNPQP